MIMFLGNAGKACLMDLYDLRECAGLHKSKHWGCWLVEFWYREGCQHARLPWGLNQVL